MVHKRFFATHPLSAESPAAVPLQVVRDGNKQILAVGNAFKPGEKERFQVLEYLTDVLTVTAGVFSLPC